MDSPLPHPTAIDLNAQILPASSSETSIMLNPASNGPAMSPLSTSSLSPPASCASCVDAAAAKEATEENLMKHIGPCKCSSTALPSPASAIADSLTHSSTLANGDKTNEGVPYVVAHPLMTYLLSRTSHESIVEQIAQMSGCRIEPRRDYRDRAASAEKNSLSCDALLPAIEDKSSARRQSVARSASESEDASASESPFALLFGRSLDDPPPVLSLANGVTVSLVRDSIANVDAGALVSCTDKAKGSLEDAVPSCQSIFAAGGRDFAELVHSSGLTGLPKGAVCKVTCGRYGSLKCDYVVHLSLPACSGEDDATAEQTIQAKAFACLEAVRGIPSIAFPLAGFSDLGYSAEVLEKGLLAAATEWAHSGKANHLRDIRVLHAGAQGPVNVLPITSSHIIATSSSNPRLRLSDSGERKICIGSSLEIAADQAKLHCMQEEHLLVVTSQKDAKFAGDWLHALDRALTEADGLCLQSLVVAVQNGGRLAMTPTYLADLFLAACVKFEATSPKHLRSLRPHLASAVAGQAFAARLIDLARTSEKSDAELWRSRRGRFAAFANEFRRRLWSPQISTARQLCQLEARLVKFGLNVASHPCTNVDLSAYSTAQPPGDYVIYGDTDGIAKAVGMLNGIQKPLTKDAAQDIRFVMPKGFSQRHTALDFFVVSRPGQIPFHWKSSESDGPKLIPLPAQSDEFTNLHGILQRSNKMQRKVIMIERIENASLFRQYLIQKEKVARSCPNGHRVERHLFHGTRKEHLDGICAEGFDRSRAGQSVGAVYGSGSYFSTSFDYSADPNYARKGHVLYCMVLVGESVQGHQGLSVLPYKPGFPGVKYESAVNNLRNPSIFVIFADCNAYPAYLITVA